MLQVLQMVLLVIINKLQVALVHYTFKVLSFNKGKYVFTNYVLAATFFPSFLSWIKTYATTSLVKMYVCC